MVITWSELIARDLLNRGSFSNEPDDIHEAANQIILLAEKIKAERAIAAMESGE